MRLGKPGAAAAGSVNIAVNDKTLQFFRALKSLQLAILEPAETPFLAYRAIESIRHTYYRVGENRRKMAGETWERMWADLGISRERTKAIQDQAEQIRHGGSVLVEWGCARNLSTPRSRSLMPLG